VYILIQPQIWVFCLLRLSVCSGLTVQPCDKSDRRPRPCAARDSLLGSVFHPPAQVLPLLSSLTHVSENCSKSSNIRTHHAPTETRSDSASFGPCSRRRPIFCPCAQTIRCPARSDTWHSSETHANNITPVHAERLLFVVHRFSTFHFRLHLHLITRCPACISAIALHRISRTGFPLRLCLRTPMKSTKTHVYSAERNVCLRKCRTSEQWRAITVTLEDVGNYMETYPHT
jgi:hypothetical protein